MSDMMDNSDDLNLLGKMFTAPDLWPDNHFCVVEGESVDWKDATIAPNGIIFLCRDYDKTVTNNYLTLNYYKVNLERFVEMTEDEVKMLNMTHPEYKYQHWVDLYRGNQDVK